MSALQGPSGNGNGASANGNGRTAYQLGDLVISSRSSDDSAVVLELFGEFDLAGVERFRESLDAVEGNGKAIVIDLSGLDFIDSAAIAELVYADKRARMNEQEIRFLRGTLEVERITKLAALDQVLQFED